MVFDHLPRLARKCVFEPTGVRLVPSYADRKKRHANLVNILKKVNLHAPIVRQGSLQQTKARRNAKTAQVDRHSLNAECPSATSAQMAKLHKAEHRRVNRAIRAHMVKAVSV